MCYSAIIQQSLLTLSRRFQAAIDWPAFENVLTQRAQGEKLDITRGLDEYLLGLADSDAQRSQQLITQYRARVEGEWQQELFKQRKRLADRERELAAKETKTARKDAQIAKRKVEQLSGKLKKLRMMQVDGVDNRIFPRWYAPLIVNDGGGRVIRPMRYQCRLAGKPSFYDKKFPGTYNARRDSLDDYWSPIFGKHHGILIVDSFFENVPRHLYERRELGSGETEENMVLHFNPNTGAPMIIACLWSHWAQPGEASLESFAAITDEPPPEILITGHTRCIISVKEENVRDWLSPEGLSKQRLDEILSDKVTPIYKHVIEQREAA
jgi:putative SOS response-associated peptidase YedK